MFMGSIDVGDQDFISIEKLTLVKGHIAPHMRQHEAAEFNSHPIWPITGSTEAPVGH